MQYDKTLAPSQTYTDTLSNIKGLVSDMFFTFRLSPVTTAPNSRINYNIDQYDILDSGGITIIGDQVKSDSDRFVSFPEKFGSRNSIYMPLYHYSFSEDIKLVVSNAVNLGNYYFSGFEQFRYITPASVTNAVITLTPNANPTAGSYRFVFTDPLTKDTEVSDPIAFNATAATMKQTVEAMPNFRGIITFNQPLSSGAVTATFSGAYSICADKIKASNLKILVENLTGTTSVTPSLSTPGVRGFVSGNYTINILSRTFAHLKLLPDGSIIIANTY
jgi:hypothetical protein